ncbi:ribosomal protein L12E/L44/L45/RPP1/RPP2 [Bradyrhizobium sp. GM0.4]
MAGSSIIGALRVVLGADTAALDKGLDDSRTKLGQFAGDLAQTGAVIAAAITAAYAAVALGVSNTLKSMDELNKQSQKIGIPVEQLSALKLAADLSDVSMEQLGVGVGKLSKNMVAAAAKPTSDAANAFRALGVSVKDSNGQLVPTQEMLLSLADKFSGLKDGAGKTAAAIAIFGKSGADLIPFLNAGRDGIQGMIDNAQKFGVVIDGPTAAAAEKFRDTLTMLGAAKDGIIVKLTAFLLPALQQFADRMLAGASNADKQQQKLSVLKTAFEGLARVVLLVADNFKIVLQLGAVFVAAQVASTAVSMAIAFVGLARAIQSTGIVMAAFEAVRSLSLKGLLIMAGVVAIATGNFDTLKEKLGEIASYVATKVPGRYRRSRSGAEGARSQPVRAHR